jgi:lipoprotein-anchoring transpeptidase ErfK/SrfK
MIIMMSLKIVVKTQQMVLYNNEHLVKVYSISTAKKGVGEQLGSEQTPRGWHVIRAKIGQDQPENAVFRGRRFTGEIYTPDLKVQYPDRDWILTRIFWLSGLEHGRNRLGSVDTMRRYVYIHGTPDETSLGIPGSHGCIRMNNQDILELFDLVPVGAKLLIEE